MPTPPQGHERGVMFQNMSAFLGMTVLYVALAFFVIYWAVRLGVGHALEERDARRRGATARDGSAEGPGVESDVES